MKAAAFYTATEPQWYEAIYHLTKGATTLHIASGWYDISRETAKEEARAKRLELQSEYPGYRVKLVSLRVPN